MDTVIVMFRLILVKLSFIMDLIKILTTIRLNFNSGQQFCLSLVKISSQFSLYRTHTPLEHIVYNIHTAYNIKLGDSIAQCEGQVKWFNGPIDSIFYCENIVKSSPDSINV